MCLKIIKLLPGDESVGGLALPSTMAQLTKNNTAMTAVIDFIFSNLRMRTEEDQVKLLNILIQAD